MKALTPQELRIGNYITSDRQYFKEPVIGVVYQVSNAGICFEYNEQGEMRGVSNPLKHIHPIQLTKEWLEKFGFENHSPGLYRIKIHPDQARYLETMLPSKQFWDFTIIIEHNYTPDDTEVWIRALHYVHELQNLLYALTGEERG